jgi:hypothetical protein
MPGVKRVALAASTLCLVLVTPAGAGDKPTRVVNRHWSVALNESTNHEPTEPGGTFEHCPGDIVTDIRFKGTMVHPQRKGVGFDAVLRHDGQLEAEYGWYTRRHGRFVLSLGTEGGQAMEDGKWLFRFTLDSTGKPIAKTWIRLKTVGGPAC